LQPERCLTRRDPEKKPVGLIREIGSLRSGYNDADFVLPAKSHGYNPNIPGANGIRDSQRPVLWFGC
jgi:hypothetical protein